MRLVVCLLTNKWAFGAIAQTESNDTIMGILAGIGHVTSFLQCEAKILLGPAPNTSLAARVQHTPARTLCWPLRQFSTAAV